MRTLSIINAEYVDEYKVRLFFSDETMQTIDFAPFLFNHPHPQHNKYRRIANFKQFHTESSSDSMTAYD